MKFRRYFPVLSGLYQTKGLVDSIDLKFDKISNFTSLLSTGKLSQNIFALKTPPHSSPKTLVLPCLALQEITTTIGVDNIMDRLIEELEEVMQNYNIKEITTPTRAGFHYERPNTGLVEWMPIYHHEEKVTIKVVGYHPQNPAKFGLPTIVSTISAYDTATGHLTGVMDGVIPTALRTGAASAIASKYMARPDSSCLGLIGCGAQAVTQIHAISRIFDLKEILVYDINPQAASSLAQRCEMLQINASIKSVTMAEVVANANILITATSIDVGAGPLFDGLPHLKDIHVNAVGSDFPGKTELPLSLLKNSFVCPDFAAQAVVEGECQQLTQEDIGADIVEVVQNPLAYQFAQSMSSVYDSTGWALQDHVTFSLFESLGRELGLGEEMAIESLEGDAANPYNFLTAKATASLL